MILVQSPNGVYVAKTTLAAASTAADAAGKTVVVTSPQVVTTAIAWPSDRELRVEKGGSVTFSGAGALTGLPVSRPEWFGSGLTALQLAANASKHIIVDKDITISAATFQDGTLITGRGVITQDSGSGNAHMITSGNNCTFDGLKIIGYTTTAATNWSAVYIANVFDVKVLNCTITGKQVGIQVTNTASPGLTARITLRDNRITAKAKGIRCIGYYNYPTTPAVYAYVAEVKILNNSVDLESGYDAANTEIRGIVVTCCNNVLVDGNTSYGFSLSYETFKPSDIDLPRMVGITFTNNLGDIWMCIDNCTRGIITNNTVNAYLRPVVHLDHPSYPFAPQLEIIAGDNMLVSNNQLIGGNGPGISAGNHSQSTSGDWLTHDIVITNNIIKECVLVASATAGISLGQGYNVKVTGNKIINCGHAGTGYAIAAAGNAAAGKFGPMYNIEISGNTITGMLNSGGTQGVVYLYYLRDVVFKNNIITNNSGSGLSIGVGVVINANISGNTISNNTGYAVYANGGGNLYEVVAENNDLTGNCLGAFDYAYPEQKFVLRNNKGLVAGTSVNAHNTFEVGDYYNINHATNKWVRCTAAGTFIAAATYNSTAVTATTVSGTSVVTVNRAGAIGLVSGQYISIAGVTGTKKITGVTMGDFDATGIISASITVDSNCDATVTTAAVSYVAGTIAQVL
jgi:hypothetical protein